MAIKASLQSESWEAFWDSRSLTLLTRKQMKSFAEQILDRGAEKEVKTGCHAG